MTEPSADFLIDVYPDTIFKFDIDTETAFIGLCKPGYSWKGFFKGRVIGPFARYGRVLEDIHQRSGLS